MQNITKFLTGTPQTCLRNIITRPPRVERLPNTLIRLSMYTYSALYCRLLVGISGIMFVTWHSSKLLCSRKPINLGHYSHYQIKHYSQYSALHIVHIALQLAVNVTKRDFEFISIILCRHIQAYIHVVRVLLT